MKAEEIRKRFKEDVNDAVILHFAGHGYGFMAGVEEYIVILTDLDELERWLEPAPQFELDKVHFIDGDNLHTLPRNRVLAHKV